MRRAAIHISALMCTFIIIDVQITVKVILHFLKVFVKLDPPLNPEVFIQKCPVKTLYDTVALRPSYRSCPVFNFLKL